MLAPGLIGASRSAGEPSRLRLRLEGVGDAVGSGDCPSMRPTPTDAEASVRAWLVAEAQRSSSGTEAAPTLPVVLLLLLLLAPPPPPPPPPPLLLLRATTMTLSCCVGWSCSGGHSATRRSSYFRLAGRWRWRLRVRGRRARDTSSWTPRGRAGGAVVGGVTRCTWACTWGYSAVVHATEGVDTACAASAMETTGMGTKEAWAWAWAWVWTL